TTAPTPLAAHNVARPRAITPVPNRPTRAIAGEGYPGTVEPDGRTDGAVRSGFGLLGGAPGGDGPVRRCPGPADARCPSAHHRGRPPDGVLRAQPVEAARTHAPAPVHDHVPLAGRSHASRRT